MKHLHEQATTLPERQEPRPEGEIQHAPASGSTAPTGPASSLPSTTSSSASSVTRTVVTDGVATPFEALSDDASPQRQAVAWLDYIKAKYHWTIEAEQFARLRQDVRKCVAVLDDPEDLISVEHWFDLPCGCKFVVEVWNHEYVCSWGLDGERCGPCKAERLRQQLVEANEQRSSAVRWLDYLRAKYHGNDHCWGGYWTFSTEQLTSIRKVIQDHELEVLDTGSPVSLRVGHLFRLPCGCKFRVEVFGVDEYAHVTDHSLAYFCAKHTRESESLNNAEAYEWDLNKRYYEDDAEASFWLDWKTAELDDVLRRILVSPTPSPLI